MNILVDEFPESLTVDGVNYAIDTDFRDVLRVILAYEDETLTQFERQLILLNNLYGDRIPRNTTDALERALWFLNGGKDAQQPQDTEETQTRLYSFSKDANFIFSAFRQTHGIDLQKTSMHWWEFLALFMDLGSETTFSSLIGLRKRVKSGAATKEERAAAQSMGEVFEIPDPDTRTLDEKEAEAEFLRLVAKQGK